MRRIAFVVLFFCLSTQAHTANPAIGDWQSLRFGMFIHWGPVSLKGTEIGWSRGKEAPIQEYDELYRRFDPVHFNARVWVATARAAGMKYIILTAKHHDGFCLWNTETTDYDIMQTPFGRDVVAELAAACHATGMPFGVYYSIADWYHPDYPLGSPGGKTEKPDADMRRYTRYLHNQVGELIGNYGPLLTLWFDGEWEAPWTHERGVKLYEHCKSLQPSILVNNRVDKGRQGMEGSTSDREKFKGDYETPEQRVGVYQPDFPWESCITICEQWAWKPNDDMKSLQTLVHTLVQIAGGDGNLLLNVGPMPDGRIETRQAERLMKMGEWLDDYGASIYNTRGGPFDPGNWGASTHRGDSIFVHVLRNAGGRLVLPPLDEKILRATTWEGEPVQYKQGKKNIRLDMPEIPDSFDSIIVLHTKS